MKTKVFFLFYFSMLLSSLLFDYGCCSCGDPERFFNIDKIYLKNATIYDKNNNYSIKAKTDSSSLFYQNYGLIIDEEVSFIAQISNNKIPNFNFSNTLYACSCVERGFEGTKQIIDKIEVKTLMPYDIDHPANSDVTSLFYISEKGYNTSSEKLTIQSYIAKLLKNEKQLEPYGLVLIFNHTDNFIEELEKKGETKLQFSINITFTDQTTLSATSHEAILKFNP